MASVTPSLTRHFPSLSLLLILGSVGIANAQSDSVNYVGPEEVVRFSPGAGEYQMGLSENGSPVCPIRLIATDSLFYILDPLNHRAICYDTSGNSIREINLSFRPRDMAVDGSDRVYLLNNSVNPVQVIIFKGAEEIERMEVEYDSLYCPEGLVVYPEDSLLFLYGWSFYKPIRKLDVSGILSCTQVPKKYRLKELQQPRRIGQVFHADGVGFSSTSTSGEIYRKKQDCLPFLGNDSTSRIFIGVITSRFEKGSGSFTTGTVEVIAGGKYTLLVKDLPGAGFSHATGWRNVSIDNTGIIYAFVYLPKGEATILRWRPAP